MDNPLQGTGIIGEGKMGTNIFHWLLDFDFPVTLVTSQNADTEKLEKNLRKKLNRSLDAGIIDETRFAFRKANTRITKQLSELSGCDLIIEAIPENLRMKQEIFREIDAIALPDCVFATNSSSVKPSALFPSPSRCDKVIGLHFFYPVSLKNIVELITSAKTSLATIKYAEQFLNKIKRDYLLLDEKNGFILNKIFLSFQNEAFLIVNEGKASIRQMDELVKENFFPFGIFDFMDSVGLSTMLASIINYTSDYSDKARYEPLISHLQKMLDNGKLLFYSDEEDVLNPLTVTNPEILPGLRASLSNAIRQFTDLSGLPANRILAALNEYFGTDMPGYFHQ